METVEHVPENESSWSPSGGHFSFVQAVAWMLSACILGGFAAWFAVVAQFYFAPLLLFPILIGVLLGASLVGLLRAAQIGHRPTPVRRRHLAAVIAIVGIHYLGYREACRQAVRRQQERENDPATQKAQLFFGDLLKAREAQPPDTFLEFLRDEAKQGRVLVRQTDRIPEVKAVGTAAWLSWAVDGLLLLLATVGVMAPAARQPFCNGCRSWYRTIRSGRIAPGPARRLAEVARTALADDVKAARYRLSNCSSGCGPTRLELSWQDRGGQTYLSTTWLDAPSRDQVGTILDQQ